MTTQPPSASPGYDFGSFHLDPNERVLLHAGQPVPLTPKAFETLLALVERRGHIVIKEELMQRIWPDTYVEEVNLAKNVSTLRKILGARDDGQPYIETIPKRGYRFVAEKSVSVEKLPASVATAPVPAATNGASATTTAFAIASSVSPPGGSANGDAFLKSGLRTELETPLSATVNENESVPPVPVRRVVARRYLLWAAVLILAGWLGWRWWQSQQRAHFGGVAPNITLKRLTFDSLAYHSAISPDGKYVAYVSRGQDKREAIWLKELAGGSAAQVMPPTERGYRYLAFAPDNSQLYYATSRADVKTGVICRVPLFGGTPQEVITEVWGDFSLSPDGQQIAFVRGRGGVHEQSLFIANVDGSGERELARNTPGENWFGLWGNGPSWSPDGQRIVFCAGAKDARGEYNFLLEARVSDGALTRLAAPRWRRIPQALWLAADTALLVVAQEKPAAPYQIWRLNYPDGTARRVTNDLHSYARLSLTADARLLVAMQQITFERLWVLPDGDTARARQLTFGEQVSDGFYGLSWTPDGKLLFSSNRSGDWEIWRIEADGSNLQQLTTQTRGAGWVNTEPIATLDGRYIIFDSNRTDSPALWRMDADGANPTLLKDKASVPRLSPDGQWVYYTDGTTAPSSLWKINSAGGAATRLTEKCAASEPALSPDGRLLAYQHFSAKHGWRNGLLPSTGGAPLRLFDWHAFRGRTAWTPDGQALIFIKQEWPIANLWRQPLTGGRPQPFTHFQADRVFNFAFSSDGRQLAVSRGNHYSDVVLIRGF
jgi:Tol biopolymer transport system component/DNA-binding winged helix-turn-helix (wHTH) protein